MLNFCTLFDSAYLSRGMAMYHSLLRQCHEFNLYVFAFDDACLDFLIRSKLDYITVISLGEFEDEKLLMTKSARSRAEYCWTCTPSTIRYVLNQYQVENCTYIDADLYFFASPQVLLDEVGENSILLTEHRYTGEYDQTNTSGKYCVQFVFFKNDERARVALEWWRNACLEWCFNRQEDGKFGDQKYLDDWCTRFDGVCELQHLGGGVAPWNMQQYTFMKKKESIYGIENTTKINFEIVFFHFHSLTFISSLFFAFAPYYKKYGKTAYKYVFTPYVSDIMRIRRMYVDVGRNESYKKRERHIHYDFYEKLCCIQGLFKSYFNA